jgi:hypothetical protein
MTTPGAVWAMKVISFPGFGTSLICFWFIVAETSPFSARINGASPVTVKVVSAFAISSVTFTETGGPSNTLTVRLSSPKPLHVIVSV